MTLEKIYGIVRLILSVVIPAFAFAFLIQHFIVKPYGSPGSAMEPAIKDGEKILISKIAEIKVGQIVALTPPENANKIDSPCLERAYLQGCAKGIKAKADYTFIRRIVAGPGDSVAILRGRVILNGKHLQEPYIVPCLDRLVCNLTVPVEVPKGYYYVMGDNRDEALDSRFWGPIPEDQIIGKAMIKTWPPGRIK